MINEDRLFSNGEIIENLRFPYPCQGVPRAFAGPRYIPGPAKALSRLS